MILSVEDDPAAYQLIEMGFDELDGDFRLYRVNNGEEALNFSRRRGPFGDCPKPDLVLLNLNMPRIDGFQVLQAMKADAILADIPAVVFSSSSLDHDKAKCLALGARDFVTKPRTFEDLV